MNRRFQEYKKCQVVIVDPVDLHLDCDVRMIEYSVESERKKEKYNRAKVNREFRRRVDDEWDR